MDRITALIAVEANCPDAHIESWLENVPDRGVHASVLVVAAAPTLPVWAYSAAPYGPVVIPDDWQDTYQNAGQVVAEKANQIERLLQAAGLQGDVTTAFLEAALLEAPVAARASLCDLALMPDRLSGSDPIFQSVLQGLLFRSPSGVVLNSTNLRAVLTARRPFVAWDASLPASRAVHRALPILKQAEQVTVAVFDPVMTDPDRNGDAGADVAAWLSRHGCNVAVQQYPSGGKEIGECIKTRATETGADLIVMGAYGHSRARERLLGGTTRTMIEQTKLPVLMVH